MFVLKSTYALLQEKYDTLNMSYKLYVKKCKSLSSECDELLSENIKQKSEINMLNSYIRELQKGNSSLTYMDFKNPTRGSAVTELPSGKFERLNQHLNEVAEEIRQKSRETPPPQSMSHYFMTQDTSSSRDYSSDSSSCSSSSSSSSSSSDSSSCSSSD